MNELDLLIDLHLRNDRQGPGGEDETQRAIELAGLTSDASLRIADIGCGAGASTLVLARTLDAPVTAVDAAPAFVAKLQERAAQEGLADRITPLIGRMEALPFEDEQFDVIWSEGAIYNMGFGNGVADWRRFLKPGGVLAVSELVWLTPDRPVEVHDHWTAEYPGITTTAANIAMLEQAGYTTLGSFILPSHCWTTNYYAPVRAACPAFLERHGNSDLARTIVAAEEKEIALYDQWGEWYGYAFYVARKHAGLVEHG